MANKPQKLNAEKDADLLKAVIQASGGIKGGVVFWKDVASMMNEDINGEAARKRFDKFKPGAVSSNGKAKLIFEKDADLLKAIIGVNGGVGKGKVFWDTVAGAMAESVNGEAARKRFDKFRAKGPDAKSWGGEEAATAAVEKEVKKRGPVQSKAIKNVGKGKKTIEVKEDGGSDGERQEEAIAQMEDGFEEGQGEPDAERTVIKTYKSLKAYVAEGKGTITEKRAWVEEWVSDISSSGAGDEELFDVVTPTKPIPKGTGRPAKKTKL